MSLHVAGRNAVYVSIGGDDGEVPVYVAPAASIEWLAAHVLLPDGARALDVGAAVTAHSRAALLGDREPRAVWSEIDVEVTVTLDGHEPVEFTRRMGDRAPESVTLEPAGD